MSAACRFALLLSFLPLCYCLDAKDASLYAPIIATVFGVLILLLIIIIILCRSYKKIKAKRSTGDPEASKDRENLMPTIQEVEEDNVSSAARGGVEAWRKDLRSKLPSSPAPTSDEDEPNSYHPRKSSKPSSLSGSGEEPDGKLRTPLVASKPSKAAPGNITGKTPRSVKEKDKSKKRKDSTPIELDELPSGQSPYSTMERNKQPKGSKKTPVPRPRSVSGMDMRARNAEDNRSRKSVTFEDDKISRKSVTFDDEQYSSDDRDRGYGQTDQEKLMHGGGQHPDMYGPQGPLDHRPPTKPKPVRGFSYGIPPGGIPGGGDGPAANRPSYRGSSPMLDDPDRSRDYEDRGGGGGYSAGRRKYGSQGDGLDGGRGAPDTRSDIYAERRQPYSGSRAPDSASAVYSSRT